MIYLIPTYMRERLLTVETLEAEGVEPSRIYVGTQTEEDFHRVKETYPKVRVLLDRDAHNAAGNRNQLLRAAEKMGERYAVCMDDDIIGVPGNVDLAAQLTVDEMLRKKLAVVEWSTNDIDQLGTKPKWWLNWGLSGRCLVISTKLRFDEAFDIDEDVELFIRCVTGGERCAYCMEFKAEAMPTGADFITEVSGGCERFYRGGTEVADKFARMLYEKYPKSIEFDGSIHHPIFFFSPTLYWDRC